jgi:hypothetical protein
MTELSKADKLNNVISKLVVISDFIKRIDDDSYILESSTPLGLHLIMGECIDELKIIGGLHD